MVKRKYDFFIDFRDLFLEKNEYIVWKLLYLINCVLLQDVLWEIDRDRKKEREKERVRVLKREIFLHWSIVQALENRIAVFVIYCPKKETIKDISNGPCLMS